MAQSINIREARRRLSDLVDAAAQGESFVITRRGQEVAKLVPAARHTPIQALPALGKFRQSVSIKGKALSRTVADTRRRER